MAYTLQLRNNFTNNYVHLHKLWINDVYLMERFLFHFFPLLLYLFFLVSLGNVYYKLGDASSPHGSNCLQFNGSGVGGDGSKSSSPSLPAANGNEGLSRQQLDLISQIMQQAKPNVSLTSSSIQNGQKSIQRPRTWNIQVKAIAIFFLFLTKCTPITNCT